MKTNNIKPNYSELARIHECDRRTIKKYDEGYQGKPTTRNKESKLDKYKDEIKDNIHKIKFIILIEIERKKKWNFCKLILMKLKKMMNILV